MEFVSSNGSPFRVTDVIGSPAAGGAEGKTTKQAAGALTISVRTAEWYRAQLMAKLRIHDTAGLVRYAIRHGVIHA